ncbi:MAG: vWA domain-containing protein [Thermodesulfobacteriota bacterium]
MKFYNQVLLRSLEITQSSPSELKVLVSDKFDFPSLGRDDNSRVIRIPKPIKRKDGYMLEGMIFENSDLGRTLLMKTLMASVEHLSVHSSISDFSIYTTWLKGKDPKIAVFVIDLIEDLCVKVYSQSRLKGLLQDMAVANAVSYAAITDAKRINSTQFILQSALLSFFIAGRYRFLLPSSVKNDVMTILASLHNFEKTIWQRTKKAAKNFWWIDDEIKAMKIKVADAIYKRLTKYGSLGETVYLPYTDAHEEIKRVNEELTLEIGQSIDIAANTFRRLGLQLTSDKSVRAMIGGFMREEASNLLYDLMMEEKWKSSIIKQYSKLTKNTEFDRLIFPDEDFAEYARTYTKYAGSIRKVIEQIRSLRNDVDSNPNQEVGQVDIQEVIQAISGQKMSHNIFTREDILAKNESWGILLDMSTSSKLFSTVPKDTALCLAEIANVLIPEKQSWGLYAFSNKFAVVKEMSEDYSQNVKARIGGLEQGGLSYIPDALQLGSHIVTSSGKDHNHLFVISDGIPSGYANIEAKLEQSMKEVRRGGINVISIGTGTSGLQRYSRGPSLKADNVHDLMREFTKMYFSLSTN